MDWLQNVCNIIIIVGGAIMAIKGVSEWLGIPVKVFKKKSEKNFETKVRMILEETLPNMLVEHDKKVREKYLADREAYLQEIKKEVLTSIQGELNQVGSLSKQYETLAVSARDVLREKIMQLYFKNKPTKTLTLHEKEALDQYIKDYKAINGNSYIDKYNNRMQRWTVIDDDDDED